MVDKVRVYVKSEKVPVGVSEQRSKVAVGLGPSSTVDDVVRSVQYDYFLPDDQKAQLLFIEEICRERGYEVEVVDVTKQGLIKKLSEIGLTGRVEFPVLVAPNGKKVSGKSLNHAILQELLPADLTGKEIRAIVYIKAKKGREKDLVHSLLELPEVREAHLIPGDWDILAVLGLLPTDASAERAVLDYVIKSIRSNELVESTSTIVPVYSYSKLTVLTEARRKEIENM
jgi:DNA-binding Lrp family transcriptional regulator